MISSWLDELDDMFDGEELSKKDFFKEVDTDLSDLERELDDLEKDSDPEDTEDYGWDARSSYVPVQKSDHDPGRRKMLKSGVLLGAGLSAFGIAGVVKALFSDADGKAFAGEADLERATDLLVKGYTLMEEEKYFQAIPILEESHKLYSLNKLIPDQEGDHATALYALAYSYIHSTTRIYSFNNKSLL